MEIMASSTEIENIETVIMKCSNAVPVSENELNFLLLPNEHSIVLPTGSTTT